MREGWEIKKLGEVATILNGYAFDSKLFSEDVNDIPLIRIRDIQRGYTETYYKGTYSDIYIINRGDYLIGMDGEFNIAEWNGPKALLNQRVCKISACGISKKYLYWYVSIVLKQIEDATPFVTVKHLSSKRLLNANILIPPLSEQERIVAELDLLSDVIAKKREQLKQLDTLAQSIFYDMFGDPFLMSNAKESVPLGSICVINPHKSELKNIDKNTLCSFVGMAQIGENGELTLEHNRAIKDVYKGFTFFREGDVLFAKITPCMENGKGAIAKRLTNKIGFGSTEFHVIRPNNKITDKYIYYLLSIPSIRKWAESKMTGAGGQRRVPTSFFDELRIILPSLPLQQQFASKIESIEKQKELIKQSLSEVQQLFDSRMDYYFG